jgi:hypothetical protein
MNYYESQQQNPMYYPQQLWAGQNLLGGLAQHGAGLGQAAFGQPYGQFGQNAFGQAGWGGQPGGWGQQRQLTHQDVSDVVRQLLPILPQILAQAQQPYAGIGYAAYGPQQRTLSQHDVNEVVRQLLPIVPQIAAMLQSQPQLQHAAIHGGYGPQSGPGNLGSGWGGQNQNPFAQNWQQSPFGQIGQFAQPGWPQMQAAFGNSQPWGQQRQLSQHDVAEVVRQLIGVIPQTISGLQAYGQQRVN